MLFQFIDEVCQRDLYFNDFYFGEVLCCEVIFLCRKDIKLYVVYLIYICIMNYIVVLIKNGLMLELKKKDLIEYLIVKKNRDRKVLFYFLEFYKREYSLNMIKWDFLNLFEGLCRICILLL